MQYLRPLVFRDSYYVGIEREIQEIFDDLIYRPIGQQLRALNNEELENSMASLLTAIRKGIVWYQDGQFKGSFSSAITRDLRSLGATFNSISKTFSLPEEHIPVEVRFAQVAAESRVKRTREEMLRTLGNLNLDTLDNLQTTKDKYHRVIGMMQSDFDKTVSALTIVPQLSEAQRDIIASQWGENLNLYIKGWSEQNILKLRTEVQEHAFSGGRAADLAKTLQSNYASSKAKAKFLARQETSLLMSKYRETRYSALGIEEYKWSTSHDERVRHDHKILDNKVFRFDEPPVTNRKTGARNNPGEDFNCRCQAIPIAR